MPINLDTRSAIRHPDLGKVIQAVIDADDHDESDWIEWKSNLDLPTKKGSFAVARTILGMANRMPKSAALVCDGLGYIIVGAEPGNLSGVVSVDPAVLDQLLEPWLGGAEGPRYTLTYVHREGKKVLIVVVEAPKNGDPIYTLRKEFERVRDGDVFVRKAGRTERANSADLKALTERAVAVSAEMPNLEVSLVGDVPLSWFSRTTMSSAVSAWVGDRQHAMQSVARREEAHRRRPVMAPAPQRRNFDTAESIAADYQRRQEQLERALLSVSQAVSLARLDDEPDTRTLDEYLAEVEVWGERATKAGPAVFIGRYLRARHGLVAVRVHNPSGRYLPKVMVEVHFEWDRVSSPKRGDFEVLLQVEPRPYGEPTPTSLSRSLSSSHRIFSPQIAVPPVSRTPVRQRSWTEKGSVTIKFDIGDLRQEATDTSEEHYLFLPEPTRRHASRNVEGDGPRDTRSHPRDAPSPDPQRSRRLPRTPRPIAGGRRRHLRTLLVRAVRLCRPAAPACPR